MSSVGRCFFFSSVSSFTKKTCFDQVMLFDQSVIWQRITASSHLSGGNRIVSRRLSIASAMSQKSGRHCSTNHSRFHANVGDSKVARVKRVSIEGNIGKYFGSFQNMKTFYAELITFHTMFIQNTKPCCFEVKLLFLRPKTKQQMQNKICTFVLLVCSNS